MALYRNLCQPLCLLNLCCLNINLLKGKNHVFSSLFCALHPLACNNGFLVNIHQMTNILSPEIFWPLTLLINRNSGKERFLLFLSFVFFFPQGSNGVQGQWNCVLVDFFFPRGDLPFPSLSLLRYIPLPLFITFQHRFGRQTKAALSCGDLACGSRTQRPGIAGLPSVSPR